MNPTYSKHEVELYDDYLRFIETFILEEYNFDIKYSSSYQKPYEMALYKKDKSTYIIAATIMIPCLNGGESEHILEQFEVMSYERWKKILERDTKINKLLNEVF